jgi:hypothetical protein
MVAPCGIDCATCQIFIAANDPQQAERLAESWRAGGRPQSKAEWFQCQGCRGDEAKLWSEDCLIRKCCMDEKGLESCSQCEDFPCETLERWTARPEHHAAAFKRLKEMKALLDQSSRSAP